MAITSPTTPGGKARREIIRKRQEAVKEVIRRSTQPSSEGVKGTATGAPGGGTSGGGGGGSTSQPLFTPIPQPFTPIPTGVIGTATGAPGGSGGIGRGQLFTPAPVTTARVATTSPTSTFDTLLRSLIPGRTTARRARALANK